MNKVAQYYRELVASLTERLKNGERDIDELVASDITDKTQLEWREVFKDVSHHGVYHSGEVVGLGNLVCEQCHYHLAFYTPEVLPLCPKCGHDQFQRRPFEP